MKLKVESNVLHHWIQIHKILYKKEKISQFIYISFILHRKQSLKMDEPLAKRSKQENDNDKLAAIHPIESNEKPPNYFDILPPEIVEHILEFLHPNDLANMSQTCRKYNQMVPKYFQQKRQCGWVRIISKDDRMQWFNFVEKQKYEIIFRSIIRRIEVYLFKNDPIMDIFKFIKENCSTNIRSLVIRCFANVEINESYMQTIGEQIKYLDLLSLDSMIEYPVPNINCNIQWERFTNLQTLYAKCGGNMWLTKTFPMLHTLLHIPTDYGPHLDVNALTNFFRNNMQIETLTAKCLQVFESIFSSNINLLKLILDCRRICNEEAELFDQMEKCYNQIESFDLKIDANSYLNRICRMEKVKTLHWLPQSHSISDFIDMNIELSYIERLCFRYSNTLTLTETELIGVLKCFPNVTELWFRWDDSWQSTSPNKIVTILVDNLPKLVHLHLWNSLPFDGENFALRNWNSGRHSMENVPIVMVYVKKELDECFYDFVQFKANRVIIRPKRNAVGCLMCAEDLRRNLKYFDRST